MIVFKALGALIDYPTAELMESLKQVEAALAEEGALPPDRLADVRRFIRGIEGEELLDLQERWVGQFDRSKRLALHLYEHSHGESRDRGQAMVNLALAYRMYGLELAASETPDYLPVFLEFLSQVPEKVALHHLADATEILEALRLRLEERESTYALLLGALVSLCRRDADAQAVEAILAGEPEDPDDLEALDRDWAEEPVTFSPGAALGDCAYAAAGG